MVWVHCHLAPWAWAGLHCVGNMRKMRFLTRWHQGSNKRKCLCCDLLLFIPCVPLGSEWDAAAHIQDGVNPFLLVNACWEQFYRFTWKWTLLSSLLLINWQYWHHKSILCQPDSQTFFLKPQHSAHHSKCLCESHDAHVIHLFPRGHRS